MSAYDYGRITLEGKMLLGFKKQFADLVESGKKKQTIRAKRKDGRMPKPGEILYCYTGLMTKKCRKIGEFSCKSAHNITFVSPQGGSIYCAGWCSQVAIEEGDNFISMTGTEDLNEFAKKDGFESYYDMVIFFIKENPSLVNEFGFLFNGVLIEW